MLAPISLHIAIIGHGKNLKSLRKFVWRKDLIVERIDNGSLWQAISAQFNFMPARAMWPRDMKLK